MLEEEAASELIPAVSMSEPSEMTDLEVESNLLAGGLDEFEVPSDWEILDTDTATTTGESYTMGSLTPTSSSAMPENTRKRSRVKKSTEDRLKKRCFIIRRNQMTAMERAMEDKQFLDRYRYTFSRLVYTDIRRSYAQMYTNVLNSGDPALVRQFFGHFTVSRVQFLNYMANQVYNLPPIILTDQQSVAEVYVSFLDPKADATTRLLESQVIRHYDTKTSDLSFLVRFTAHHVDHSVASGGGGGGVQVSAVDFYCKSTFSLNAVNQITSIHLVGRSLQDVLKMQELGGLVRVEDGKEGLMDMLFPVNVHRVVE